MELENVKDLTQIQNVSNVSNVFRIILDSLINPQKPHLVKIENFKECLVLYGNFVLKFIWFDLQ